ncbi:MAG: Rieske (2Fe-2S) protein [Candidatus Kryptoniota bacterium]
MGEFVKIAESSDLVENKGIVRMLSDDEIVLVKFSGKDGTDPGMKENVSAFVNVCPHQHTQLVDKYGGQIAGDNLICPMHGWMYDLKTGQCVNESGKLKMLDVKTEGGSVFVRKITKEFDW